MLVHPAGVIDNADDPYLPYYPGDQYVDWVGLSLYNYGQGIADPDAISNFITFGTYVRLYGKFAREKNKSFILSETERFSC